MYNKINLTPAMLAGLARNAKGQISCIFLHWSAGYYGQSFKDYHLCIDGDGKVYSMCLNLTDKKAHTWHRNTGSVGIAMNCCWGATVRRKSDEEKDAERLSQISDNRYQGQGNDYVADWG
ncbi:MAG: N-acetylmuramoyl-L-alanine amidase, partial [Phascolarctobacterium sp.]|nr:N-acetylmuramoyl-L-alanine amidase [Candidatus Phascolarctobacterium equi]